jgi:hypothetical protein
MGRLRMIAVVGALGAALGTAAGARADGLPLPGVTARAGGVASRDGRVHYVTRTGHGRTTVRRVLWRTGRATGSRTLTGDYTIPAVALDGSAGGLSANGHRLVLIRPRATFPQGTTHLAILVTGSLRVRDRLNLRGDFSFDAISPTGRWIYLIHYLSKSDPTRYEVRRYDVAASRLAPGAIVDPSERGPRMRGYPITRAATADGRWAYTLYDGGGKAPFIHALDTVRGRAVCIDGLDALRGENLYRDHLALTADADQLWVLDRAGAPIAAVNTKTLKPTKLPPLSSHPAASASAGGGSSWSPGVVVALAVVAAGALAIAFLGVGGRLPPLARREPR